MGEAKTGRMSQLDGLRAIAVLAVLHHHFVGPAGLLQVSIGSLGVWLFCSADS